MEFFDNSKNIGLFCLYLISVLFISANIIYDITRHKGFFKLRWKICIIAFVAIIPPVLYFGIKDSWRPISFSGEITQIRVLEHQHSYREYTIVTDSKIIKTIDPYNVLYKYKIGDWVEKRKGEKTVRKLHSKSQIF